MINIYCIEDINGLKYIGSTKDKLDVRFKKHKCISGNTCSSRLLDLKQSKIFLLEKVNDSERKQKERFWINNSICVNEKKLNYDKNNDNEKRRKLELQRKLRHYQNSWGGDPRFNNNLLQINIW